MRTMAITVRHCAVNCVEVHYSTAAKLGMRSQDTGINNIGVNPGSI